MAYIMFQFRYTQPTPSLEEVATHFAIKKEQLDPAFGVIPTDSVENLYVVMVAEEVRKTISRKLKKLGLDKDPAVGIFSNPDIESFDDSFDI